MSDERLSEELENYSSRMQEYNTSRRVGVLKFLVLGYKPFLLIYIQVYYVVKHLN